MLSEVLFPFSLFDEYSTCILLVTVVCDLLSCSCLSDVHTNKKSSLKSLIDCFPDSTDTPSTGDSTIQEPQELEREGMKMMMVPPTSSGHSLTHEQVMPFLKKLEHGQMREGTFLLK